MYDHQIPFVILIYENLYSTYLFENVYLTLSSLIYSQIDYYVLNIF